MQPTVGEQRAWSWFEQAAGDPDGPHPTRKALLAWQRAGWYVRLVEPPRGAQSWIRRDDEAADWVLGPFTRVDEALPHARAWCD